MECCHPTFPLEMGSYWNGVIIPDQLEGAHTYLLPLVQCCLMTQRGLIAAMLGQTHNIQ